MSSDFNTQLRRVRLFLRAGRLIAAVLVVAALAGALWLSFGLIDSLAAFESGARLGITKVLVAVTAITGLVIIFRSLGVPAAEAAAEADAALADPRRSTSAALSLESSVSATPLAEMLTQRTMDAAAGKLTSLPAGRIIPWSLLRRSAIALIIPVIVIGILRLAAPAAFSTIVSRLLDPSADIPPYSPLVFQIDPAKPTVVYGGELQLAVEITGAKPAEPIECLVRRPGSAEILRLPAFRESATRFSRKIDGLTETVDIAFASGRARSHWHPVEILLEPKILGGMVRITPPAYTGLAETSFALDTNEIAAIEGSTVTLELTSNRPLASGSLDFTPVAAPGEEPITENHPGTISALQSASFTWTATHSGRIAATLRDLRNTPTAQALDLAFRALPDLSPAVDLSSPPQRLLATPRSVIPIIGNAEDDFALSRLQFVRTLSGFRDRVRVVAPELHDKNYAFNESLDLDALGLEAGQIVELMLEASDHNPSLLGHGSSAISRIEIISEEQYAEYIRAKTTIAEFTSRFRAARDAMENARETLEKLKRANEGDDAAAIEKALEDARKAQEDAAELLEKIAGDFPAFELEKRLQDLAKKQAGQLRKNLEKLKDLKPGDIDDMLRGFGEHLQQAEQLDEDIALAQQAALLLEMAAKFRQIYETQASLAKRFRSIVEEFRQGENQNRRLLPSLAETQEKNRKALDDFKVELRRRAEKIDDPLLAPLVDSALKFLTELEVAEPETLMDAAAAHGKAGRANDAFTNAERARALLERLMSEPEPFPEAAMGKAPKFEIPRPDVNANIEQMLKALLGQNPGEGNGQAPGGQGGGGTGGSGVASSGFSMDLPVVGPDRLQFDPLASGSDAGKGGNGKTGSVKPLPENAETSSVNPTETRDGGTSSFSPESVPEPYREAVKRYFTP